MGGGSETLPRIPAHQPYSVALGSLVCVRGPSNVEVDYRAEHGQRDSLIVPLGITLCSPTDRLTPDCQQPSTSS